MADSRSRRQTGVNVTSGTIDACACTIDTSESPCRPRPNLHVVLTAASCVPGSQSRLPLLTCSALVPTVPTQHAVMSRRRRFAKSIPTAAPGQPVAAQHSRTSRPFPLADPARACPCPWQVTCNFTLGERGDRSRKPPASALRAAPPGPNTIDVEGPGPTPLNSPKVLKIVFLQGLWLRQLNWPCSRRNALALTSQINISRWS